MRIARETSALVACLALGLGAAACGGRPETTPATLHADLLRLSWDLQTARDDLFVAPFDLQAQRRVVVNAHRDAAAVLRQTAARRPCRKSLEDVLADGSDAWLGVQALKNDAGRLERDLPYVADDVARVRTHVARLRPSRDARAKALAAAEAAERSVARMQSTMGTYLAQATAAWKEVGLLAARARTTCLAASPATAAGEGSG